MSDYQPVLLKPKAVDAAGGVPVGPGDRQAVGPSGKRPRPTSLSTSFTCGKGRSGGSTPGNSLCPSQCWGYKSRQRPLCPRYQYGPRSSVNDDWVRRAAAIEPAARPPASPTRRTIARYPLRRRRKVTRDRYQATARISSVHRPFSVAKSRSAVEVVSRPRRPRATTTSGASLGHAPQRKRKSSASCNAWPKRSATKWGRALSQADTAPARAVSSGAGSRICGGSTSRRAASMASP